MGTVEGGAGSGATSRTTPRSPASPPAASRGSAAPAIHPAGGAHWHCPGTGDRYRYRETDGTLTRL